MRGAKSEETLHFNTEQELRVLGILTKGVIVVDSRRITLVEHRPWIQAR
jgi:hypothetical protein